MLTEKICLETESKVSSCSWISVAMEHLVSELAALLKMLDQETVSQATADQMASVRNILDSLKLSGTLIR